MWRRLFGIPPPFQGVTASSDGMEPPSERPPSYQVARLPTKSLHAPVFQGAPWAAPLSLQLDDRGGLQFEGLARAQSVVASGPFSPLFENERARHATMPRTVTQELGVLEQQGEVWVLCLGARTLVNGTASPRRVELCDGDVVEANSERGPWHAWVVRFTNTQPGDTGAGPLWQPLRDGTFTLEATRGVLTGAHRFASLEWLRRIGASEFSAQLTSLKLELTRADAGTDWEALATEHHQLAAGLPFEVQLSAPRRSPRPQPPVEPWVLIPAQRHHAPLERVEGGWALKLGASRFVFVATDEGLALELKDLALAAPTPWFTPMRVGGVGCVFLPGHSPFLSGQRRLPTLSVEGVRAFALELGHDVAREGLLALADGAPGATPWLARLSTPYQPVSPLQGFIAHDDGEHCCGFFTVLRIAPWLDFEKDLPVLLEHPLMQHLRSLELFPRLNMLHPPALDALRRQAQKLRPDLEVLLPVLRLPR